jgi:hypothetical protein
MVTNTYEWTPKCTYSNLNHLNYDYEPIIQSKHSSNQLIKRLSSESIDQNQHQIKWTKITKERNLLMPMNRQWNYQNITSPNKCRELKLWKVGIKLSECHYLFLQANTATVLCPTTGRSEAAAAWPSKAWPPRTVVLLGWSLRARSCWQLHSFPWAVPG